MMAYRGDGVGLGAVGELSGGRAVGGVGSDDLSGILDRLTAVTPGGGASHEGGGSGDHGGTHFCLFVVWEY